MTSIHWPVIGTVAACAVAVACPAAAADLLPAWMAGSWCSRAAAERTEEVWLAPAGGFMLGMSRTVAPGQRQPQFEFLRIELRGTAVVYVAQPQGRPPVEFKLVQAGDTSARFENLAHDFPKRIDYRREGQTLRAEISGPGKGGKELVIGVDHGPCPGTAR